MINLDLTEILRGCPKGTKLYSPLYGEVLLDNIRDVGTYPIRVRTDIEDIGFTEEGKYFNSYPNSECLLFPSREQRDWSKFKAPREDLPVDTPVMVKTDIAWHFRYYAGNGAAYLDGSKSVDDMSYRQWNYIIPFEKFNPNDIEGCIKNFNYGTKQ